MAAKTPVSPARQAQASPLGRWLRLGAGALVLLVLSETLWLWQTWPVRELLETPRATTPPATNR